MVPVCAMFFSRCIICHSTSLQYKICTRKKKIDRKMEDVNKRFTLTHNSWLEENCCSDTSDWRRVPMSDMCRVRHKHDTVTCDYIESCYFLKKKKLTSTWLYQCRNFMIILLWRKKCFNLWGIKEVQKVGCQKIGL